MTWWMILLLILAVFVLIGLIPVGCDARYDGSTLFVSLKVWFFRIGILPEKKKKAGKKDKAEKKEKKPKPGKKAEPETAGQPKPKKKLFSGSFQELLGLLQLACDVLGDLRRKLRVELFSLAVVFGGDDPADAALNYGRAWCAIGMLEPLLSRLFVIQKREISPVLDYQEDATRVRGQLILTVTIGRILALVLHAAVGFFRLRAANKKNKETAV